MSNEDFFPFDKQWLDPILQAVGGFEGHVRGLRLVFETEAYVTATIMHDLDDEYTTVLDVWGVAKIAAALNLPYPAQEVIINMGDREFVTIECRLIPKNVSVDTILGILQEKAEVIA